MFDESLVKTAQTLVAYCREGKEMQGLQELYAPDAVSVEAAPMPGGDSRETAGIDGIRGKHDWWSSAHEVHSSRVEGPFLHGPDQFSAIFELDVTNRDAGQRMQMKEVGVYTVKDGKIVREEFYYGLPE